MAPQQQAEQLRRLRQKAHAKHVVPLIQSHPAEFPAEVYTLEAQSIALAPIVAPAWMRSPNKNPNSNPIALPGGV